MPIWRPRITHHEITVSPLSAEQMAEVGSVMANTIRDRIQSATNVQDQPAKPLTPKYATRKVEKGIGIGRFPKRNWVFRDVTLKSIKVKSASEDQVRVGFIDQRAINIVSGIARYDQLWGTSPKDTETFYAILKAKLLQVRVVKVVQITRVA